MHPWLPLKYDHSQWVTRLVTLSLSLNLPWDRVTALGANSRYKSSPTGVTCRSWGTRRPQVIMVSCWCRRSNRDNTLTQLIDSYNDLQRMTTYRSCRHARDKHVRAGPLFPARGLGPATDCCARVDSFESSTVRWPRRRRNSRPDSSRWLGDCGQTGVSKMLGIDWE